jgi:hypothetical protein
MALVYGYAGAGKTASAKRYRDEQPVMTANGLSPVLYLQLAGGESNHRALYNRVLEAITQIPNQNRTAAAALAEVKRLIQKYGFDLLIVDEVGFLRQEGLEGARTLHDETGIGIVFITMPNVYHRLASQDKYDTFYSRLAGIMEFGMLDETNIKRIILPNLSERTHLKFKPGQRDEDDIAYALFVGADGTQKRGARFREIAQILERCHHMIQESIDIREFLRSQNPDGPLPSTLTFNVDLIEGAVNKTKDRGKKLRKPKPKNSENDNKNKGGQQNETKGGQQHTSSDNGQNRAEGDQQDNNQSSDSAGDTTAFSNNTKNCDATNNGNDDDMPF